MLQYWYEELHKNVPDCAVFLVGNKLDLAKQIREVDYKTAEEYAKTNTLPHFEVSSKTGEGVTEMFTRLGQQLMGRYMPS